MWAGLEYCLGYALDKTGVLQPPASEYSGEHRAHPRGLCLDAWLIFRISGAGSNDSKFPGNFSPLRCCGTGNDTPPGLTETRLHTTLDSHQIAYGVLLHSK